MEEINSKPLSFSHLVILFSLFHYVSSFNHTIICPKAFKIGAEETVVLNLHGYNNGATIRAYLQDLPRKGKVFSRTQPLVLDETAASQPINIKMKVSTFDIGRIYRRIQKVGLVVEVRDTDSFDFTEELEVLLSRKSGYLFVVTHKPVYRPGERLNIKVYRTDQALRRTFSSLRILVRNPSGIGVFRSYGTFLRGVGFPHLQPFLPVHAERGSWTVEVFYDIFGYETRAETKFLVEDYVIPTFEVSIDMERNYVRENDREISGRIRAVTNVGEPLAVGNVFFAVKVKRNKDTSKEEAIEIYREPFSPVDAIYRVDLVNGFHDFTASLDNLLAAVSIQEDFGGNEGSGSGRGGGSGSRIDIFGRIEIEFLTLVNDGASIFIEAYVRDGFSGEIYRTTTPDIPLTTSAYFIDASATSQYFTPGLLFYVMAEFFHAGTKNPASEVAYQILVNGSPRLRGITDIHGRISRGIRFGSGAVNQRVSILTEFNQAPDVDMIVRPYQSPSRLDYLQVYVRTNRRYKVGEFMLMFFNHSRRDINEIRYVVISRGSIVYSSIARREGLFGDIPENFPITQNMIPSSRVVAYYIYENEVVSNSLWFDVEPQCSWELEVRNSNNEFTMDSIVDPESMELRRVELNFKGPLNAIISVTAVDKAMYLLYNDSRLMRDKLFNKMEEFDQGCVKSGGQNGIEVFNKAGLTIATGFHQQQSFFDLNCTSLTLSRKKRNILIEEFNQFEMIADDKSQNCNFDGSVLPFMPGTNCTAIKEQCVDSGNTINCCNEMRKHCAEAEETIGETNNGLFQNRESDRSKRLKRSDAASVPVSNRVHFPENLIFEDQKMSHNGSITLRRGVLTTGITTFEIDAISMQNNFQPDGLCIAQRANIRVTKTVYLQLFAPSSLKRLEQTTLTVVLHYNDEEPSDLAIDVRIPQENEFLCTKFVTDEWTELLQVRMNSSRKTVSATLTVLPIRGHSGLTVHLRVRTEDGVVLDRMEKSIPIEREGVERYISELRAIDLRSSLIQFSQVLFPFPNNAIGSRECWFHAYTIPPQPPIEIDRFDNDAFRNATEIFGNPVGSSEETLMISGPNVYLHMYLLSIGINLPGTPEHLESLNRFTRGYERLLTYRSNTVNRRAFGLFADRPPSTWVNAFAIKVFLKAYEYVPDFDISPLCNAKNWLLSQQEQRRYFVETQRIFNEGMQGGVGTNLTLTCYLAISLMETQGRCDADTSRRSYSSTFWAMRYVMLFENSTTLRRPYAHALFAYALALYQPNSDATNRVLSRLLDSRITQDGVVYWQVGSSVGLQRTDIFPYWYNQPTGRSILSTEATGYALMAIIERERHKSSPSLIILEITRRVAQWLLTQRQRDLGFRAVQDSVIGLQALATYEMWTRSLSQTNRTNITIDLTTPNTAWRISGRATFFLNDTDAMLRQEIRVPSDVLQTVIQNNGAIQVRGRGHGEAILSYRCRYRETEPDCPFNLRHNLILQNASANDPVFRVRLTFVLSNRNAPVDEMVLEVGLLPGFTPDLDSVVAQLQSAEGRGGYVERFDYTQVSIIFYVRNVTRFLTLFSFEIQQTTSIAKPQPALISLYDIKKPEVKCRQFYSLPTDRSDIRSSQCLADSERSVSRNCRCAEGPCLACRIREDQLNRTLCLDRPRDQCNICAPGSSCFDLFARACDASRYDLAITESLNKLPSLKSDSAYVYQVRVTSVIPPLNGSAFHRFTADITAVHKQSFIPDREAPTFTIRSDCLEQCNDDALQAPDRNSNEVSNMIQVDRELLIIGPNVDAFFDENEFQRVVYPLDGSAVVERIFLEQRCEANEERYVRFSCGNLPLDASLRRRERCDLLTKHIAACENQRALFSALREGCDLTK